MPNMTLSLDEETYRFLQAHKSVNWSEVARDAFRRKARELHMWNDVLAASQLTEGEAVKAGRDAKAAIAKRLGW